MKIPSEIIIRNYTSRVSLFNHLCENKKVLHIGCSSGRHIKARLERGSLLHQAIGNVAAELYGIDLDGDSLKVMETELGFSNLHQGDAEKLEEVNLNTRFDIVLAGDLLEHITRPGAMLDGMMPLLKPGGKVVISTNNAFGLHYQLKRWTGRYKEHFQHVCFFSPETLLHLFKRHGYEVLEMYGAYTEPPYTTAQKIKFFLGAPLFRIFPVLAGTLIVVASPAETGSRQLDSTKHTDNQQYS